MTTLYQQIFDEILDELQANGIMALVFCSFAKLNTVNEKSNYVDEMLAQYFRNPDIQLRKTKSNEKSMELRNSGNVHFANTKYLMALKMYNKSICYAENDSEEISLGYANRSAVYCALGLHDDCLKNIELAMKISTLPATVMDKLNKRKTLCLEQRTDKIISMINPQLSFPPHPQVPFIANCLELRENTQYGRHIITTVDLKAGDVVAIEESFCSCVPCELKYQRCENCLIENNQNLIPCKYCTSVMFCGDECYAEAYNKFHKFECSIIHYIQKMFHKTLSLAMLALRTVICAITTFNSPDELMAFVEETRDQDVTVFNCNFENKSRNAYGPVHFLSKENLTCMEELTYMIFAAMVYQPLLEFTQLGEMFTTTEAISFFKELVYHFIIKMSTNHSESKLMMDDLPSDDSQAPDKPPKPFALSVHPFRSLINHSCASNIITSSYGTKIVFTISRPIKAGEQLFDYYG